MFLIKNFAILSYLTINLSTIYSKKSRSDDGVMGLDAKIKIVLVQTDKRSQNIDSRLNLEKRVAFSVEYIPLLSASLICHIQGIVHAANSVLSEKRKSLCGLRISFDVKTYQFELNSSDICM